MEFWKPSWSIAIADVDADGSIEVVILEAKVHCLIGTDGTQKWEFEPSDPISPGSLADIDGDGKLEYLFTPGGLTPYLYCLNAENGTLAWSISLPDMGVGPAFVGDIDNDGCSEIVVGTGVMEAYVDRVYALDDPGNVSNCGALPAQEGSREHLECRVMGQGIYLFTPQPLQVSLGLYDMQGRLVHRFYDGVLSEGGHTFSVKVDGEGVYIVLLRSQEGMRSFKLIR